MPCYSPVSAFQLESGDVVFSEGRGRSSVRDLQLPCGQCIGCRLERSRQWAVRCMQEASLYDCNVFLTLTYSDECLPGPSLVYRDFQLFLKRLRRARPGQPLRFFMCGEYGDLNWRPHFHSLLFNCWFPDRVPYGTSQDGSQVWISEELTRLWGLGHAMIGSVTYQSAAYVARYCVKKVTGSRAEEHYRRVDVVTGETYELVPEFMRCSLRPGIGRPWLDRYVADVYHAQDGCTVVAGVVGKAPRFYDKVLEETDPDHLARIKFGRVVKARKHAADQTDERLAVREEVQQRRARMLRRAL